MTALRVREIRDAEEFRALGPTWDRVHAAAETRTPFLTHPFALTWWESFGAGQELAILLVEDEEGATAIAPLARAVRGAGPFRYLSLEVLGTGPLRFLGMGLSDRSDFLLARRRDESARAILAYLARTRDAVDVLDLRFLPVGSTLAHVLDADGPALGLEVRSVRAALSPYLTLEGSYEDYLARRGRNFRKGLKRKLARLEEMGPVRADLEAGERDPGLAIAAARAVSASSWKENEGSALLLHDNVRAFFERLGPRLAPSGGFYVALLRVGDRLAAHELGFRMDGKLWSYDTCFDHAFAAGSPGVVLTARVLERAYALGLAEYDFMRGNEGYKAAWATREREEAHVAAALDSPRGRTALRVLFETKWALKESAFLVQTQGRIAGALNRILIARKG